MTIKEQTDPYKRTIELNKQLGLVPRANRYSVAGAGFYGLYDDVHKMKADLKDIGFGGTKMWKVASAEPDRNTYKALNNTYKQFAKINGFGNYIMEPITKENSNSLIFPKRATLFTHI